MDMLHEESELLLWVLRKELFLFYWVG